MSYTLSGVTVGSCYAVGYKNGEQPPPSPPPCAIGYPAYSYPGQREMEEKLKKEREERLEQQICYECGVGRCKSMCDICERRTCREHSEGENGDYDLYGPCYCLRCNVEIEALKKRMKDIDRLKENDKQKEEE